MARTKVEIINLALIALGEVPITSVADDRKAADHANRLYDTVRQSVLRSSVWNFALRRAVLSAESTSPAWGSVNRYALPDDFLRMIRAEFHEQEWSIEGGYFITEMTDPGITYIADIEDPDLYDPLFVMAFVARLAAELALTLFGSDSRRKQMEDIYQERLMEARHKDAIESSTVTMGGTTYLHARYTYDGGEAYRPISEV